MTLIFTFLVLRDPYKYTDCVFANSTLYGKLTGVWITQNSCLRASIASLSPVFPVLMNSKIFIQRVKTNILKSSLTLTSPVIPSVIIFHHLPASHPHFALYLHSDLPRYNIPHAWRTWHIFPSAWKVLLTFLTFTLHLIKFYSIFRV